MANTEWRRKHEDAKVTSCEYVIRKQIDIVEYDDRFELWVRNAGGCSATFEFGVPKVQPATGETIDFDGFVDMVDDYIDEYGI